MPTAEAIVQNCPPRVPPGPGQPRLAVIGESPGLQELNWWCCPSGHGYSRKVWRQRQIVDVRYCPLCGKQGGDPDPTPFVGPSGHLLNQVLDGVHLPRDRVFLGNICQWSDLDNFWIRQGKEVLAGDLDEFEPNVCLLFGNMALRHFHPATGEGFDQLAINEDKRVSVGDWRGSMFHSPFLRWQHGKEARFLKCVVAYHPAAVLRQPAWTPLLRFDATRARAEADTPELDLPVRRYLWPIENGLEERTTR